MYSQTFRPGIKSFGRGRGQFLLTQITVAIQIDGK